MNPRPRRPRHRANSRRGVEGAGIHVPGLQAENRAVIQARQRIGAHPALPVHRHADHPLLAQPQQRQGLEQRAMRFFAHHDSNLRSAEQPIVFHVPPGALENRVPRRRERAEIGRSRARHRHAARAFRQSQQLAHPADRRLLQREGHRRQHPHRSVLVPRRYQPTRRHGRRNAAAVHKPEVAPAAIGHRRGRPVLMQQMQHCLRACRPRRQRPAQRAQLRHRFRSGRNPPLMHIFQVVHRIACCPLQ